MTEELTLLCPRCSNQLKRARALAVYDKFNFRASEVLLIIGTQKVMLAPFFCSRCGFVELYLEKPKKADSAQKREPSFLHRRP